MLCRLCCILHRRRPRARPAPPLASRLLCPLAALPECCPPLRVRQYTSCSAPQPSSTRHCGRRRYLYLYILSTISVHIEHLLGVVYHWEVRSLEHAARPSPTPRLLANPSLLRRRSSRRWTQRCASSCRRWASPPAGAALPPALSAAGGLACARASHAPARGGLTCGGLAAVCQLVAWHAPAHCCAMGCRGSQRITYGCRSPRTSGCPTGHPAHARSSGRPRVSCAAPLLRRPSLTWVFARHARGAASGAQRARLQGLTGGRRAPLAGLCARCTSPARRAWRRPWPGSWTTRAMPTWTRPSWCRRRAPVTLCPHPRASKTCALFWDQCHRRRPCSGMVAAAGRLLLACPSASSS